MTRRKWFQFSLLTAFVMMLMVSGLLWLNIRPVERRLIGEEKYLDENLFLYSVLKKHSGWPCPFIISVTTVGGGHTVTEPFLILLGNVLFGIGIVVLFGATYEHLIRYRERKKHEKQEGSR